MFGDRIHIRVAEGDADQAIAHIRELISDNGGDIERLRPIPAQLEDVFMQLLESGK